MKQHQKYFDGPLSTEFIYIYDLYIEPEDKYYYY